MGENGAAEGGGKSGEGWRREETRGERGGAVKEFAGGVGHDPAGGGIAGLGEIEDAGGAGGEDGVGLFAGVEVAGERKDGLVGETLFQPRREGGAGGGALEFQKGAAEGAAAEVVATAGITEAPAEAAGVNGGPAGAERIGAADVGDGVGGGDKGGDEGAGAAVEDKAGGGGGRGELEDWAGVIGRAHVAPAIFGGEGGGGFGPEERAAGHTQEGAFDADIGELRSGEQIGEGSAKADGGLGGAAHGRIATGGGVAGEDFAGGGGEEDEGGLGAAAIDAEVDGRGHQPMSLLSRVR